MEIKKNSFTADGIVYKVGDKIGDYEITKITHEFPFGHGAHAEPMLAISAMKNGKERKASVDYSFPTKSSIIWQLNRPRGGRRARKTHRRKSHKRRTHKRRTHSRRN
jgi:hypothetical protein